MSDTKKKTPGKYVCQSCGGDNLSFSFSATWDVEKQEWDYDDDGEKAFCQDCECRGWSTFVSLGDTRTEPQLDRDFYDDLFVVVDDAGEPVGPYHLSLKRAREYREDHGDGAEHHRIAKLMYRALPNEDGTDEIVDDPRPMQEPQELPTEMWP